MAATGNRHKNLVKIGCVVLQLCERTDRQTYSSQYSAVCTPPGRGQSTGGPRSRAVRFSALRFSAEFYEGSAYS